MRERIKILKILGCIMWDMKIRKKGFNDFILILRNVSNYILKLLITQTTYTIFTPNYTYKTTKDTSYLRHFTYLREYFSIE